MRPYCNDTQFESIMRENEAANTEDLAAMVDEISDCDPIVWADGPLRRKIRYTLRLAAQHLRDMADWRVEDGPHD